MAQKGNYELTLDHLKDNGWSILSVLCTLAFGIVAFFLSSSTDDKIIDVKTKVLETQTIVSNNGVKIDQINNQLNLFLIRNEEKKLLPDPNKVMKNSSPTK